VLANDNTLPHLYAVAVGGFVESSFTVCAGNLRSSHTTAQPLDQTSLVVGLLVARVIKFIG